MNKSREVHVAIIASPGMGHLGPVLLLGRRLTTLLNHVKVSIIVVSSTMSPPTSDLLKSLGSLAQETNIQIIALPPVDISHLITPTTQVVTQICMLNREALPSVKSAITAMIHRPDALILDLFLTEAIPIAEEHNIPKYVFVPTTAWNQTLWVYVPVLDKEVEGPYLEQQEAFKIPGCKPMRPEIVVDPMWDREDQKYFEYLRISGEISSSDGIIINSWEELEPVSIQALRRNEILHSLLKVPVFPVGPLSRAFEPDGLKNEVVKRWLDKQQDESVLYVSFGSGGTLSSEQMLELACGLELSNQMFIWVVRPPAEGGSDGAFFSVLDKGDDSAPGFLPPGYMNRVEERGLLLPMWGQQVEILNHKSVGGFMSHCGWNSTLESVAAGVPMIAWPLYAEQAINATLLSEDLGVAIRPQILPLKATILRDEIAMMVKKVMEEKDGKVMREKVKNLQLSGQNALTEGGSSYNALIEFVKDIESRLF